MLARIRQSGLVLPTLLTLAGLAVLVSLGTWQLSRKAWKDALQARIEERMRASPLTLDAVMGLYTATDAEDPVARLEYRRVALEGRFRHDREQFLYAPHPTLGPGYHVLTPMELAGPSPRVVFVNRGYVPDALKDRAKRAAGVPEGAASVTGLVRFTATPGGFTPPNEPAKNLWYWRDIAALTAAAYPGEKPTPLPFTVDAEAAPANPGGWPQGGTTIVKLANRHLEYALTWYGLALTLAGVYAVYAWSRLGGERRSGGGVRYTSRPDG